MHLKMPSIRLTFLILFPLFMLYGCATYSPKPLSFKPQLANSLSELIAAANRTSSKVQVASDQPLTLSEVSALAIVGNPDLKVKRASLGVAQAQAYAAGLFGDPQFSANLDHPTSSLPGLTNAWGLGLGYDISSLIHHHIDKTIANAHQKKVHLDLVWDEWQVILQARKWAVQSIMEQQRIALLSKVYDRALKQYQQSSKNMADGNVTLDMNSSDLTALMDVSSQLGQLKRTHSETQSKLDYVLGLQPDIHVPLANLPTLKPLSTSVIKDKLKTIAQSRPDLIALQLGYQAQESKVRAAVLGQFPAFNLGINSASDTSGLHTTGLSVGVTLPLFSGNKGNIAIERASRDELKAAFQTRLAQTRADIHRLVNLQNLVVDQAANLDTYMPQLDKLLMQTRKAYENRDVAALVYLNIESSWIKSRLEQIDLLQTQWNTQIALAALLGGLDHHSFPSDLLKTGEIEQ
jgi:outer membrane protein TolC